MPSPCCRETAIVISIIKVISVDLPPNKQIALKALNTVDNHKKI